MQVTVFLRLIHSGRVRLRRVLHVFLPFTVDAVLLHICPCHMTKIHMINPGSISESSKTAITYNGGGFGRSC